MRVKTFDCLSEDVLTELVHARLPSAEAARAESHIDDCAACRQLLAELLRQRTPPTPLSTPPAHSDTATHELPPNLTRPAVLPSGTRVGRFIVQKRLGEGGMGTIYSAHDPELAREVALKLVRTRAATGNRDGGTLDRAQLRLLREAQAMARLSHPNVRAVYEVGTVSGQVYIAMELVNGVSAREYLRAAPRSIDDVLALFREAGKGLAAAHDAGLLHRDFKPDNILVSHDRRVLITDFGLARHDGSRDELREPSSDDAASVETALPLTKSGAALGTPGYIAPEQLRGDVISARADQWSFCVALFEALHGERPFSGVTPVELRAAIERGPQKTRRGRAVPSWLQRTLSRGMASDPAARFPSMHVLLDELDAAARSRRTRRRMFMAGAASVALGCALVAGYTAFIRPEQLCMKEARQQLHKTWNSERRTQAERAMSALALPYGGEVMRRVAMALDGYATSWLHAAEDLCAASRPRRALPENVLFQRSRCLELRLSEASALVSELLVADTATVEKALFAVAGLSSVSDCRGSGGATARQKLPSELAGRRKVDAAYDDLYRLKTLQRTGHSAQALSQIGKTIEVVKSVDHRPLGAELLLLRGSLELDGGNLTTAEATLHEAVLLGEAAGHDEAVALSWVKLVELGARASRLEQAEGWQRHGVAVIERLGGDLHLSSLHKNSLAMLRLSQGRRAEALSLIEQALVLLAQSGTGAELESAKLLTNLGALQSSLGQHAVAQSSHRRALVLFERELGPDHPAVATALLNLGAALGSGGDTDGEIASYTRCIHIWAAALGAQHVNLATVHQNLGTALQVSDKPAAALPHFQQALDIKRRHLDADHPSVASSQFSIGATLHRLGRSREGLSALHEARRIYEQRLGPAHPLLAKALTEIGLIELDLGSPGAARKTLSRALQTGDDADLDRAERAETRFGLARALCMTATGNAKRQAGPLAEQARRDYADPQYEKERGEIAAWQRANRSCAVGN